MPSEDSLKKTIKSIIEKEFHTEPEIKIRSLANSGRNYFSTLFTATASSTETKVELFVKIGVIVPNLGVPKLFEIENYIYTQVARIFENLQDDHQISEQRYVFPKYYGYDYTDEEPTMVLENLVSRGYEGFDRLKSIDWEYASKSVEALARFHALSFAYCNERREEFQKVDEVLQLPFWSNGEQWQGLIDGVVAVVDEDYREKVSTCLEGPAGWSKLFMFSGTLKTAVIVHGDFRPNNTMYRRVDGSLEVIPVDYQTSRFGCPVYDLIYFIVTGSDRHFREQHFQQLIDHYYYQLKLALERLGIEAEDVYGREEFDRDLKEKLPFAVYIGAMMLPFTLLAPERATRVERDERDPPLSELFAERFNDLVRDWVHWGYI